MERDQQVQIIFGAYNGSLGIIKDVKRQDPYDMFTVTVTTPPYHENVGKPFKPTDLTLFENEVRFCGRG